MRSARFTDLVVGDVLEHEDGTLRMVVELHDSLADEYLGEPRWLLWLRPMQTPETGGNRCLRTTWNRWAKGARQIAPVDVRGEQGEGSNEN